MKKNRSFWTVCTFLQKLMCFSTCLLAGYCSPLAGDSMSLWAHLKKKKIRHTIASIHTLTHWLFALSFQTAACILNGSYIMRHTLKHTYNYYHCGTTDLPPHGLNSIYAYLTAVGLELSLLSNYSFPSSICIPSPSPHLSILFSNFLYFFSHIPSSRLPLIYKVIEW